MPDPVLPQEAVRPPAPEVAGTPPGVPSGHGAAAPPDAVCGNCGSPLTGPFCAQCGQRAGERLLSLRHILSDAAEDQLSLNAALPRTLLALLLHPGRLTVEYTRARVARYIPPMRLYLVTSLVFFLALSFVATPSALRVRRAPEDVARDSAAAARDSAAAPRAHEGVPVAAGGHFRVETKGAPSWLKRRVDARVEELRAMGDEQATRTLVSGMLNAAPKVVFLLLPVFALLLKLLYIRRGRLYVEHFVFALHSHAVAFAAFTPMLLLRSGWVDLVLAAWLTGYVYLAMRRVYGQGWVRTTLKFVLLGAVYTFLAVVATAFGVLFTVLTI